MTGASTSTHPVIPGFHPDPTICRVGEDYYVAHSSFEFSPGVPVWHSRDLLTWTQIGNALDRPSQFSAGHAGASQGVFAPTLRHHDGRFWLITTDVSGGGGQLLVTARDAAGPWSDPVRIPDLVGIDPDIAWTEAGECLVTYCATTPEMSGIAQARIDPETGDALEAPRQMWSGIGLAFPEAPHLYRHREWWYLLIAEGGTERGHAVSIARSADPRGPFNGVPTNPILSHRSTTHPVQNTGHADLVECADGSWAMVFLGVRPRGVTPQFHVNGRETFLAPVTWVNGWPVVDEGGIAFHPSPTTFLDEFKSELLDPRWVSPGDSLDAFTEHVPDGGRIMRPRATLGGNVSMLSVRAVDQEWNASAHFVLDSGSAALRVRLDEAHWCEIRIVDRVASAWMRIGPVESRIGSPILLEDDTASATVSSVAATFSGPDDLRLSVTTAQGDTEIARVDGRYLSTEVAGGFTGRVVGVRALSGAPLIRAFSYRSSDPERDGDDGPAPAAMHDLVDAG